MAIVLMATVSPTLQTILHSQPFSFLGKISFGIYLAHGAIYLITGPLLPLAKFFLAYFKKSEYKPNSAFGYTAGILICCSVFLGYLVSTYVDNTCMRITTWIFNLLFGKLDEKNQNVLEKIVSNIHLQNRIFVDQVRLFVDQLRNFVVNIYETTVTKLPKNMAKISVLVVFCLCMYYINIILSNGLLKLNVGVKSP